MMTIETLAEIEEDGTLKARTPASIPRGKRRVVIVMEDTEPSDKPQKRRLPDLSDFRAKLGCRPYPGNSVVDMREAATSVFELFDELVRNSYVRITLDEGHLEATRRLPAQTETPCARWTPCTLR